MGLILGTARCLSSHCPNGELVCVFLTSEGKKVFLCKFGIKKTEAIHTGGRSEEKRAEKTGDHLITAPSIKRHLEGQYEKGEGRYIAITQICSERRHK